jgi:large subunit ribosomal protein L19
MTNLLQEVQTLAVKTKVPAMKAGHTVRVHQRIKEGEKQRIQIFEGLIIKMNSGYGADKTITVRKIVDGVGVEKIFPVYSTNIEKVEIIKISKVRRAKLYYMRGRSGKSARLKETFVSSKEVEDSIEELAEQVAAKEAEEGDEDVVAEETTQETPEEVTEDVTGEEAQEEETVEEVAEEVVEENQEEEKKEE